MANVVIDNNTHWIGGFKISDGLLYLAIEDDKITQ